MLFENYLARERNIRTVVGFVAISVAVFLAVWLEHLAWSLSTPHGSPWSDYAAPTLVAGVAFVVFLRMLQVHRVPNGHRVPWVKTSIAVAMAIVVSQIANALYGGESHVLAIFVLGFPLAVLLVGAGWKGFQSIHDAFIHRSSGSKRVVVIGTGMLAARVGRSLAKEPGFYEFIGYVEFGERDSEIDSDRLLGRSTGLEVIVRGNEIDEVIIAVDEASRETVLDLIGRCLRCGVIWKVIPFGVDFAYGRSEVDIVGGLPMIGARGSHLVGIDRLAKRSFDFAFSALVLVLLSPLFALIAVMVRLTSPGPALYSQVRIGLDGREFKLYKFRSMKTDSDVAIHESNSVKWIYGLSGDESGGMHKIEADQRITRVGSFLRKMSLDELPQFWNVLRGDMSVVGPRPAVPYEVADYTEWHRRRLMTPPGITGLWQVSGRDDLSFDEMVRLDVKYLESWNIRSDLRIVARTIPTLLVNHGH